MYLKEYKKNSNNSNIPGDGINKVTECLAPYKPWMSDCTSLAYEPQNKATSFLITLYGISGVT